MTKACAKINKILKIIWDIELQLNQNCEILYNIPEITRQQVIR